jgi:hypothetical protein
VGHVTQMGKKRNAYRLLVQKPKDNKQLGRPRRRLVNIIKMVVKAIGCGGADWIGRFTSHGYRKCC